MSKYINSYTNVLHIDENSTTVISGDKKAAIDNLNDNSIDLSLRVIGGIWSEEIVSSKITSVLNENLIEIGESNTNVKLKGTISLLDDYSKLGIGTDNPSVSLDLSKRTDALKLPKGTKINRDAIGANNENDRGLIRYNTETSQFEGFGAGNAWGSLGGVMDIDQDTYISAETNNLDNDELKFYTSNVEHMIIKSDGKVGIGTSNPSGKLEIYDNGNKILNINNNNIEISRSIIPSNSNIDIGDPENQIRDIYISDNSLWIGDTHKISHSDGKLKFRKRKTTNIPQVILDLPAYSESSEAQILQTISTFFNDNSLLTVSNIKLRHWFKFYRNQKGSDRTISIQEIFRDNRDDYEQEVAADSWLSTTNDDIYLGNDYGKIGIGTDAPNVSLDVSYRTDAIKLPKGDTTTRNEIGASVEADQGLIRYNTETSQFEGFGAGNAWGSLGGVMDIDQDTYISAETNNLDNDELKFYTSNVEHMIIKSDGKVGIGTSNPNEKLEIHDGNLELGQSHWINSNVSELRWTSKADEGKYCISKILATEKQNYNGELAFFTREIDNVIENEPIERMIIKSNGSIGIGTSEPEIDRKLDIIGNVKVTGNIFVYDEDGISSKLYTKKEIDIINSNLENTINESTYSKIELDDILNIDEINLQIRFIGTNVINDYFIKNLKKTEININKNSNKYEYINTSDKVNNGDIISLHTLNQDPNNGRIRRVAINKDNYFEIYSLHPSNNNKNLDGLTDAEYTTYNYYTKLNYRLLFRNDQESTDSISTYVKICNNQTEIEIPRNGIYDFSIIGTFDLEFGNTFCILYVRKKTDGIDGYVRELYMNPITFTETNATSTLNGSFRLYLKKDDIITFESNFKLKTGNIDVVSNQIHFSDIYNQSYLKLTERPLDYINNDIFELIKKDDSCECLNTLNLKDDTITRNKIVDNKLKTLIDLNGIKDSIPFFNNNDTFGEKTLTNEIIEGSSNNIPLENAVKKYTDDKTNNIYCLNNNVGIGKENPEVLLQIGGDTLIEGNLRVLGIYCNINVINNTSEELIITNKGTGPAVVINQTGNQPIINIKDDNVTCFYIEDGGNIGIGTDNPSVSLDLSEKRDALKLPKGTTINRDAIGANNENDKGLIRYNTDLNQFEGFGAGNAWGSLGGVMDIDQDTYISAETDNLDNDELKFYTSNVQHMIIKSDGKVGIGTSSPNGKLEIYDNGNKILNINNNIEISKSIIPSNSNIDIGDPENQIRNILSDSSIWIGDTHKISKSNGKLMFRKRKQIPDSIKTLLGKSEQQILSDIGKDIDNIKLSDLITYLKSENKNIDLNEIFGDNTNDYEEEITTDVWLLKNNNIYFGSEYNNIGIGTSTNLNDKLTVNGTIKATNLVGNLVGNLNTSNLIVNGDLINSASIKLNNKDNTENITLKVPTNLSTSSYTLTLPEDVGTENQVLSTDGTGILSFITLPSNTVPNSINVSNLEVNEILIRNNLLLTDDLIKINREVPEIIITPTILENLIDINFKYYKFEYTVDSEGIMGQTQYILNINKDIYCDILIVGGGGGGGGGSPGVGGGGGGGGLVFLPNHKLNGDYKIKVGKSGLGTNSSAEDGKPSSIEKNSNGVEGIDNFYALGGGGGGGGDKSSAYKGKSGGNGGGSGGVYSGISGGESSQNLYNGKGFGNNGGGSQKTSYNGDQSGGGGGAGGIGQNDFSFNNVNVGGEGGIGLHKVIINNVEYKFKDLFGTNVGEYIQNGSTIRNVGIAQDYFNLYYENGKNTSENPIPIIEEGIYFAGGGAGASDRKDSGGNDETLGGLGGGGSSKITTIQKSNGINGTGGGGAGLGAISGNQFGTNNGTNGGNGIVIIRCLLPRSESKIKYETYLNNNIENNLNNKFNNEIIFNSNIGIGIKPTEKLDIHGNVLIRNNFLLTGEFIKFNHEVPEVIITPTILENLIDIDYKYYKFEYTDDSEGLIGQTQYILSVNKYINCDILIVGGGGGGGGTITTSQMGGGGGGGGLVFLPNHLLNGEYKIKVGKGGLGSTKNGENGSTSSIEKNNDSGIEGIDNFYALGGGGGGIGYLGSVIPGANGIHGGSGGGGAGGDLTTGGDSIQNKYNGKGFGNKGGGSKTTSGSQSGGGGGAGGDGQDSYFNYAYPDVGGEGGIGLHKVTINNIEYKFKDLFGSNIGEYIKNSLTIRDLNTTAGDYFNLYYKIDIAYNAPVTTNTSKNPIPNIEEGIYFGGGGSGRVDRTGNFGNDETLGGLGGGGSTRFTTNELTNGINGTGGGGAGNGKNSNAFGTNGGSGIIIIRCLLPRQESKTIFEPYSDLKITSFLANTNCNIGISIKENPLEKLDINENVLIRNNLLFKGNLIKKTGLDPIISPTIPLNSIDFLHKSIIFKYTVESEGLIGQTEYLITFLGETKCDILLIGGGGSGAKRASGGGGAGGLVYVHNAIIKKGTYSIKVGNGGIGVDDGTEPGGYRSGRKGYNSEFDNIIALGGGAGLARYHGSILEINGGSGGGGVMNDGSIPGDTLQHLENQNISYNFYQYGNDGMSSDYNTGGGGGAGGIGYKMGENVLDNVMGGIGLSGINENNLKINFKTHFNINDEIIGHHIIENEINKVYFSGGGGSYISGDFTPLQKGGGGSSGNGNNSELYNALPNTGGGGGGSGNYNIIGGKGGSGIVIIKYSSEEVFEPFSDLNFDNKFTSKLHSDLIFYSNIGIGIEPQEKLDINGNLLIRNNLIVKGDIQTENQTIVDIQENSVSCFKINNENIEISKSIIPTNSNVDIGDPINKIRDLYVSDSSIWIGDQHKIAKSEDGTLKFRKRKQIPNSIKTLLNKTEEEIINGIGKNKNNINLNDLIRYSKNQKNRNIDLNEIFTDSIDDYEEEAVSDSWLKSNNDIYLKSTYNYIGIGTNNPTEKLDIDGNILIRNNLRVKGDILIDGGFSNIVTHVQVTDQLKVENSGTGPGLIVNQTGSQDIVNFMDDGTSVLFIKDGGNIGIGTDNPTYKLDVNGHINFTGNLYKNNKSFSTDDLTEGFTNLYYTNGRFDTQLGTKNTDNLTEGSTNLYYTNGRFDTQLGTKNTDNLTEGSTNLYYTNGRFDTQLGSKNTDNLTEGSTNLYYTNDRFDTQLGSKNTDNLTEGTTNLYYTNDRFDTQLGTKNTDDLTEGSTNLYYTNGRFDTQLGTKNTDNLTEGTTNLYYTNGRFDTQLGSKNTDNLTEGTTNLYYTNDRFDTQLGTKNGTNIVIDENYNINVGQLQDNEYRLNYESLLHPTFDSSSGSSSSSSGSHPTVDGYDVTTTTISHFKYLTNTNDEHFFIFMNNETSTNIPFTVDFGSGVTIKKILIVGGGGGGAGNSTNGGAGGGGGGGVGIESTDITINGIYTVSIGKGGIGNNNGSGTNGENTSIYSQDETNKLEVKGGGGGGGNVIGLSGGNGGGGGNNNNGGTINTGINIGIFSSTLLKSNTGNNSGSSSGGGGGGSGVTGNTTTKNGSDGYLSDIITNSSFSEGFYYSGGGGGVANGQSSSYTGGGGGNGGGGGGWGLWNGGNGGTSININNLTSINNIGQTTADQGSQNRNSSYPTEISGGNGLKGSGGGGGGGTYNSKYGWQGYGGNGGSGILIIKYILSSSQSSPLYYHLVFDGTKWDAIDISTNFTGQHPSLSFDNINNKIGYIVVSSGKYINKKNNKYYKDTISKNININHSIPYLYLSNKVNEKCVFGVISDKIDNLNVRLENKIIINSLGEGAIWITNINGNLLNGDYITTSIIPGLGMKQDDDILHNYTVAKITMNCDFNPQRKIIQYFDKENNKYIEEITIFNDYIYDNEYLLKYIKLDGTIIDLDEYNLCLSSNISVYKMAFVGCTYHCG